MANRNFIQHAAAINNEQPTGFRVGSGAGTFLLQRLLIFAMRLRRQIKEHSAVPPAACRRPLWATLPRTLLIFVTAASLVVVGMAPSDHAKFRISVSVAGWIPVTEFDIQFYNVDNTTKKSSQGSNIPRPNTPWGQKVSRPRQKTDVPTETPTRKLTTLSNITTSKLVNVQSSHTVLELTVNRYFLGWLLITSLLFMMQAPAGGGGRRGLGRVPDPPSYDPAQERTMPFRLWTQKLMIWSILAIDMDQGQQCAAIINQLRGDAALIGQTCPTWTSPKEDSS